MNKLLGHRVGKKDKCDCSIWPTVFWLVGIIAFCVVQFWMAYRGYWEAWEDGYYRGRQDARVTRNAE